MMAAKICSSITA
ncbi:unnamed protein product [Linum tenue]|uniref:Uncharacterized protein n=1 Tax=Linum tenue TaxID=586396 RepID=A0AAV0LCN1_9ROSI|nr:unnamed protein product [Linum tenue]